jgi:two-component system, sensor histidine kinase and response regulator
VDDKENNLLSLKIVLEKEGYIIKQARSGKEVLSILLKEFDFGLILMDVEMPDMNGFETANLIYAREKLRNIPIIFITANNYSDENIFKGYHAGAVDYIYKPFDPELLRAKVSVFAELYRKNQRLLEQEQHLKILNTKLEERVKKRTEQLLVKNVELETKNSELLKVNDDLDNFVYTASHDLKAPVTNIEGLMNSLIDSLSELNAVDDNIKVILKMVDISIGRFKETIKDLTTITKIQKNMDANVELVNLKDLIGEVEKKLEDFIMEAKADIKIAIEEDTVITFSIKSLKSIIENLLSNAIKFRSPDRKLKIRINAKKEKNYLVLSVKDNGIGIEIKNDSKIFSMFKRLHDHVEGRGIGLYIVKRIISNAGGKIEVESKVGKGSEFKVYFKNSN